MDYRETQADRLEQRLIAFGVRIFRLTKYLPESAEYRHISMQILRSGTSPAPNYAEARGAESRADFIHKMRIVQKELNETSVWLRMLQEIVAEKAENISAILSENRELARIVTASVKTATARSQPPDRQSAKSGSKQCSTFDD